MPARVRRLERVGDLDADREQALELECRPRRHRLRERLPLEALHDDEVLPLVLLDREDRADSGMVQRGRGARLALETLQGRAVARELGRQELQRDVPAEARVLRLVDDAHPAAPEAADDGVVGDTFPD